MDTDQSTDDFGRDRLVAAAARVNAKAALTPYQRLRSRFRSFWGSIDTQLIQPTHQQMREVEILAVSQATFEPTGRGGSVTATERSHEQMICAAFTITIMHPDARTIMLHAGAMQQSKKSAEMLSELLNCGSVRQNSALSAPSVRPIRGIHTILRNEPDVLHVVVLDHDMIRWLVARSDGDTAKIPLRPEPGVVIPLTFRLSA